MTTRKSILLSAFIEGLNDFIRIDEPAVRAIMNYRVPCNDTMANHPTIQVNAKHEVGMLGLLNGVIGVDQKGWGYLAMEIDDDGKILKFVELMEASE